MTIKVSIFTLMAVCSNFQAGIGQMSERRGRVVKQRPILNDELYNMNKNITKTRTDSFMLRNKWSKFEGSSKFQSF